MGNLIGKSLGRYHLLEELGEGGMATVYKALDTHLQRNVAVKVIRTDIFGSTILERLLKRFKSEGLTLAKLTHPNIVPILDYGEFDGAPYLVMPYLPGGTLKTKMKSRIPYQDAARMLLPIAQAVAHAHQQGIIHRDIKPSNILITRTGEPMLSDFGIAKILASEETRDITNTGTGIGTPEYMAPEQALGHVDERVDIYALGIVLYEMITGRIPFRADTPMGVLLKKNQEPLPRPKQFISVLPDWVENVMVRALAREPQNRFQNMDGFANALERMVMDVPTQIEERKPLLSFSATWRNFAIILLIGLCLAGLAGGVFALFNLATNSELPGDTTSVPDASTPQSLIESPTPIPDVPTPTPTITSVVAGSWEQGKIVFVARNASKVYFLHVLDLVQGGEPQLLLAPDSPTQSRYYAPWLSMDGAKLAFDDFYLGRMFVWDIDTSDTPNFVGRCASPSFSPDGTQVVCYESNASYFPVYDSNNGVLVDRIYHDMNGAVLPAWSPDGREIAYSVLEGDGKASIWRVNVEGGNPIPLATEADEDYAPSWSPDSEWIAFQSTLTSERSEIWIMRRDGTERKQVTFSGGGKIWSRGPSFSPDGKWLVFVSSQNETDGPDFGDVFVVSLLTGEVSQITNTGGYVLDWRVTWSK